MSKCNLLDATPSELLSPFFDPLTLTLPNHLIHLEAVLQSSLVASWHCLVLDEPD